MTTHDSMLRLAATQIDFELSPSEADRLDQHLRGCGLCSERATGMRRDAAAVRDLRQREPSDAVLASVLRARSRGRGMRQQLVLTLAALLLLMALIGGAIAGAALLRDSIDRRLAVGPTISPSPTLPAVPGPTVPGPTASLAPTPVPDSVGRVWRLGTAAEPPGAFVAVATGGPGYVAVGRAGCPGPDAQRVCRAGVWLSRDGETWQPVAHQASLDVGGPVMSILNGGMEGIATSPTGMVAIGYEGASTGIVWWSADGSLWERVAASEFAPARLMSVVHGRDGFVIAGTVIDPDGDGRIALEGDPRQAFWTSLDGRNWSRIDDQPDFAVGGFFDTGEYPGFGGVTAMVAGSELGYYAVGRVCDVAGEHCRGASWFSLDGRVWERTPDGPEFDLGTVGGAMSDIALGPGENLAAIAVGYSCGQVGQEVICNGVAWRSHNGAAWEPMEPSGMPPLTTVLSIGDRAIAAGALPDGSPAEVWLSESGSAWVKVSDPNGPQGFTPEFLQGGLSDGGRLILFGDTGIDADTWLAISDGR